MERNKKKKELKKWGEYEVQRILNRVVFVAVCIQFVIIFVNTIWFNSLYISAFLWGFQLMGLILIIALYVIASHNCKVSKQELEKAIAEFERGNERYAKSKENKNTNYNK